MAKSSKRKTGTKKKSASSAPSSQKRLLVRSLVFLFFATLIVVLLAGWGNWIWKEVGPYVQSSDEYLLKPELIEVSPAPPEWVRGDILKDVIHRAGWNQSLSMLDEQLPQHIADAFEFHPWVERAKVTLQYPASAQVELTYRRPAARLQIESRLGEEQIVLDASGLRLPETEMARQDILRLPLVTESVGIHLPLVGQSVEEARLVGAAEIAGILIDHWQSLGLEKITPLVMLQGEDNARIQVYQLISKTGQIYLWGAAPRKAPEGEPAADEKLKRLKNAVQRVRENGSSGGSPIDLRTALNGE